VQRKLDAERVATAAANQRAQADAEAEEAAAARARAEAALQLEIAARHEAERVAAERERTRRQAEEEANRAAAARAALEAQRVAAANAPPLTQAPAPGIGTRVKAILSRYGELLAGAAAVLLIGIAIGDWAGRNAVIEAKLAARSTQEAAEMRLRIDGDVDAFNERVAARAASAKTAPRKKPAGK